jgi:hypothetical protein
MTVAVAGRVRHATDQLEELRFGDAHSKKLIRRPGLLVALRALMGTGM